MTQLQDIQELLKERADLLTRIQHISVDGSLEIKELNDEQYIYVRKRVGGRYTSTYVGKYSEALFVNLQNQLIELRQIRKQLRAVEKQLAKLGHEEKEISARVLLNIDFARANVKVLIYDQAVLEGISTTFPQTEEILENGTVIGVTASDVQKILNLKRAWEFILDKAVLRSPSDFAMLSYIAGIVNEGFYQFGGKIRGVPVRIGGTRYVPPIPLEQKVTEDIQAILKKRMKPIEKAIALALYCMKNQLFIDGNKRAGIIWANHFLISQGEGLLVVPEADVPEFKQELLAYYEGADSKKIGDFLKSKCWMEF